ncbi:MAG: DUF2721 domain-containing protein [Rhizomicrobium sp.]|jgi:hypothetical protein
MLSTNPFIVLSYVSGPAILTNAAALLLLSTSNRFARAIDRSRQLARDVQTLSAAGRAELTIAARRVRLIARTLTSLYLSAAMFSVATLMSVLGAVIAEAAGGSATDIPIFVALVCGLIGFAAFVVGAVGLVIESRLAVRALTHETDEALALLAKTVGEAGH